VIVVVLIPWIPLASCGVDVTNLPARGARVPRDSAYRARIRS
jgi:hypothetical protein